MARTYPQARAELLAYLGRQGWSLSAPTLKVPYATDPGGDLRLWFKPQAVHYTVGRTHQFGNARAISYDLDIRKLSPEQFVAFVSYELAMPSLVENPTDEDWTEKTAIIQIQQPKPTPARPGYTAMRPGALPKNRDRRETVPLKQNSKRNPCYTGPQIPSAAGHVHSFKCNPGESRESHCEYVVGPDGGSLLLCVEKRRHGFGAWVYAKDTDHRLPLSIGSPRNLAEAVDAAKTFLRRLGFRPNPARDTGGPRITISYAIVTPESAEDGDFADTGWIDADGFDMSPHGDDDTVDLAVEFLRDHGPVEPSNWPSWQRGTWYTGPGDEDYKTGAVETRSYHLEGFTDAQERLIYSILTGRGKNPARKSMTYGQLPPRAAFIRGIQKLGPFNMTLKGRDLRVAQKAGWDGGELSAEEYYDLIDRLAQLGYQGDDAAYEFASALLEIAGYEWV